MTLICSQECSEDEWNLEMCYWIRVTLWKRIVKNISLRPLVVSQEPKPFPRKVRRKTAKSCCVVGGWAWSTGLPEVGWNHVLIRIIARTEQGYKFPNRGCQLLHSVLLSVRVVWSKLRYVLYNTFNYVFLMLFYSWSVHLFGLFTSFS